MKQVIPLTGWTITDSFKGKAVIVYSNGVKQIKEWIRKPIKDTK